MTIKYNVFKHVPQGFYSTMEVVSCYCEYADKILFLKRHPQKFQGNTWGVPAGKIEKSEDPRMAVIRETYEEVGLDINSEDLEMMGKLYCRLPHVDYVYHMFRKQFIKMPIINLGLEEHLEAQWLTIQEALKLPLIAGGQEALSYYAQIKNKYE